MDGDVKAQGVPKPAESGPASSALAAGQAASEGTAEPRPKPKAKSVDDPWGEEWFPAHRRKKL